VTDRANAGANAGLGAKNHITRVASTHGKCPLVGVHPALWREAAVSVRSSRPQQQGGATPPISASPRRPGHAAGGAPRPRQAQSRSTPPGAVGAEQLGAGQQVRRARQTAQRAWPVALTSCLSCDAASMGDGESGHRGGEGVSVAFGRTAAFLTASTADRGPPRAAPALRLDTQPHLKRGAGWRAAAWLPLACGAGCPRHEPAREDQEIGSSGRAGVLVAAAKRADPQLWRPRSAGERLVAWWWRGGTCLGLGLGVSLGGRHFLHDIPRRRALGGGAGGALILGVLDGGLHVVLGCTGDARQAPGTRDCSWGAPHAPPATLRAENPRRGLLPAHPPRAARTWTAVRAGVAREATAPPRPAARKPTTGSPGRP
jgi:hypothetical protein